MPSIKNTTLKMYQKNGSLDEKVAQVKEMRKKGIKLAVIADTVGISLATVKRYLKK